MRKADVPAISKIVKELMDVDEPPTNAAVAAEVNRRLGTTIDAKDISRVRSDLGLNSFPGSRISPQQREEAHLLALHLATNAVRNTLLEDLHDGPIPHSLTGDYSDVTVVTPERSIPWTQVRGNGDAPAHACGRGQTLRRTHSHSRRRAEGHDKADL